MNLFSVGKHLKIIALLGGLFFFPTLAFCETEIPGKNQVVIEGGEFVMGDVYCKEEQNNTDWCSDEVPHKVKVDRFAIDKYEVSNAEYKKCFVAGVCAPQGRHEDRPKDFHQPAQPVVFVTWQEAMDYCQWKGGRLPTEAEWEKAAKTDHLGGAYFGKAFTVGAPAEVGQQKPNSHGLYDMLGNVYEWTLDWYGPYETVTLQANPKGPPEGKEKVVRGGSWNSPPHFLRPSDRVGKWPDFRFSDVGFRCVVPLS